MKFWKRVLIQLRLQQRNHNQIDFNEPENMQIEREMENYGKIKTNKDK